MKAAIDHVFENNTKLTSTYPTKIEVGRIAHDKMVRGAKNGNKSLRGGGFCFRYDHMSPDEAYVFISVLPQFKSNQTVTIDI